MQDYWYSWLLFIQNWTPWTDSVGIYWVYFVANDLQFYAVILMPSVYFYLKRKRRLCVMVSLSLLVVGNMIYLFTVTMVNDYSSMLNFTVNQMYKDFYKRPMGVMGYYAFGILLSICYFEYQMAIGNRKLRDRRAYRLMNYIGISRKRCLIT